MGVGQVLLRLQRASHFGLRVEASTFLAKRRYLGAVRFLPPLDCSMGSLDCFILLGQRWLWEGLWALYSFRRYFGPCRLVVLNDGSLPPSGLALMKKILPGIVIPDHEDNNREVERHLNERGLIRCREWRRRVVFFRKIIDPVLLREGEGQIWLDADCLHFQAPIEVKTWAAAPARVRYIADTDPYPHSADPGLLAKICGSPLPQHFCGGYVCLPREALNLQRVERYLSEECFESQLSSGRFHYFAAQAIGAMEAAVVGSEVLPGSYATCPDPDLDSPTMGHFCGGSYQRTWFYTKGLPLLLRRFQSSATE